VSDELYWDPFDHDLHWDPHPVWGRLREEAPLYRNERFDFWALTRFQDVLDVLVDTATYSSANGDIIEIVQAGPLPDLVKSLLTTDPPDHTAMRHLVSRAFTPRRIAELEERVRTFAGRLLDAQVGAAEFDYVEEFGARLPGIVIAAMLGTPDSELERIRLATDAQLARTADEEGIDTYVEHFQRIYDYFTECVAERRREPRDDIMSDLLQAEYREPDGTTRRLTDAEAVSFVKLLSGAGNETVARFTGWACATLARHPDERRKLVEDPGLIPKAVEEILRYEPPAMSLARVVQRDVTWYDQVVPAGSTMVVVTAATGRDPRKFADPDRFDVERSIDRHLSFGFGAHVCLGAALARLEARIILEETLARFPEWDVDWDRCDIVHTGSAIRGYSKLPVHVGGA
jgi:cytochrome P450